MQRDTLTSCLECRDQVDPRYLDTHLIELHAVHPGREPRLGDLVYPRNDYRSFVVARVRKSYCCNECGDAICAGQLQASHRYSYFHYCVPRCANFDHGVAHALARILRKAAEEDRRPVIPVAILKPDGRYLTKHQLRQKRQCSRKLVEKYVKTGMPVEPFGGSKRYADRNGI